MGKYIPLFEEFLEEGIFKGVRKALHFDDSYLNVNSAYNNLSSWIVKKWPHLKHKGGDPVVTNGVTDFPLNLTDCDWNKKTIKLNGVKVDQDDLFDEATRQLKAKHLI